MTQSIHLPQAGSSYRDDSDCFEVQLEADGQSLERVELSTLQLNLGKMCNLACHHCHVEAGPGRAEVMGWGVMEKILGWVDRYRDELELRVVDLTGGAPEMNPHFCRLVEALKARDLHVLDRCNLTILLEPEYKGMVDFLARHGVEIVASLPCYLKENVDSQRGRGVYDQSVEALRKLNAAGYGIKDSGLRLDLVYNPVGYGLPPEQESLEADYKRELKARFGIEFNRLWTITNMPIKRFEHALKRDGEYEKYMQKLVDAHNPMNVESVMCRSMVSVGWRGSVYDCDFNQMLQMSMDSGGEESFGCKDDEHVVEDRSRKLWEFKPGDLNARKVRTGSHCFGCTAGAGSSCTGALG